MCSVKPRSSHHQPDQLCNKENGVKPLNPYLQGRKLHYETHFYKFELKNAKKITDVITGKNFCCCFPVLFKGNTQGNVCMTD